MLKVLVADELVVVVELVSAPALFGGVFSNDGFFLVILRARTGPSVAVLRMELLGLKEEELSMRGIWMRTDCAVCLGSICGTGGVSIPGVSPGELEPLDLTLTTAALPRTIVCAGSGETIAFWRYMVEATLPRARLGAMLVRA